jgi:hypothetical protein
MTSKSAAFNNWWSDYERTGVISPVQLGMTRDELWKIFGEPDKMAQTSRRRPLVGIWKFGRIEFHFDRGGQLFLIYTEDNDLNPHVIAKEQAS